MWWGRWRCVLLVVAALLFAACDRSSPENTDQILDVRLRSEITHVDTEMRKLDAGTLPAGLKPLLRSARASLEKARAAKTTELRLYRLRDAFVVTESLAFFAGHAVKTLPELELLARETPSARVRPAPETSLLRQALVEAAVNRSMHLKEAAVPFAKISAPGDGLYYLAESEGNRRFVSFLRSLPPDREEVERRPSHEAIGRALSLLEDQTVRSFAGNRGSSDLIPVSAKLKEAREEFERGFDAGATLSLLEARLTLGRAHGSSRSRARAPLPATGRGTIPVLLASMKDESPGTATLVSREVVPLFASLLTPAPHTAERKPDVVVTLLRWPYT